MNQLHLLVASKGTYRPTGRHRVPAEADIYLIDEPSAYLDVEQRVVAARVMKRRPVMVGGGPRVAKWSRWETTTIVRIYWKPPAPREIPRKTRESPETTSMANWRLFDTVVCRISVLVAPLQPKGVVKTWNHQMKSWVGMWEFSCTSRFLCCLLEMTM